MRLRLWAAAVLSAGITCVATPVAWGETEIIAADAKRYTVTWTSADCRSCHRVDEDIFTHPVDVRPSMAVPAELPLSVGELTCTTCHMDTSDAHAASRAAGDNMLRSLASDCATCHTDAQSNTNPRVHHGLLIGKAHYQWSTDSLTFGFYGDAVKPFDAAGTDNQCMSCHDGSGSQSLGNSHPSDVTYRRTRSGNGISTLFAKANLDRRLRLFDNKVTCQTCHSPFSDEPRFLVMANQQSQMCNSCHDMR